MVGSTEWEEDEDGEPVRKAPPVPRKMVNTTTLTAVDRWNFSLGIIAFLAGIESPEAAIYKGWINAKRQAELLSPPDLMKWAVAKIAETTPGSKKEDE